MTSIYLTPFDYENMEDGERYEDHALTDYDLDQMYREMLDEAYGTATVAGMQYDTSRALYELDPTAYRTGFSDWLDSMVQDDQIIEVEV